MGDESRWLYIDFVVINSSIRVLREAHETHTRTADVSIDLEKVINFKKELLTEIDQSVVRISVTQAVIYGWYDNELGSYVNILGDRIVSIADNM